MQGNLIVSTIVAMSFFAAIVVGEASVGAGESAYTLYRNSVADSAMRIHIATFDADQGDSSEDYNRENCWIAANLFQSQPSVTIRYWCERGIYRK